MQAIYLSLKDIYLKRLETPEQGGNIYSFEAIVVEQLMGSISELKVQEFLGHFITIIKDFSVWF